MRLLQNLRLSLRYVRMRLLESLLAVVGTLLGVAVIASAVTLIQTYNASVARELSGPTYRLIEVSPPDQQRARDVPIIRVGAAQAARVTLDVADLARIKAACPSVDFVFAQDHTISMVGEMAGMTYTAKAGAAVGNLAGGGMGGAVMIQGGEGGPSAGAFSDGPVVTAEDMNASGDKVMGASVTIMGDGAEPDGNFQAMTLPDPSQALPPPGEETIKPLLKQFDLVRTAMDGFGAWGATLARGSLFTEQDTRSGAPVLVLGDDLAREMFGTQDPLGQKFRSGGVLWTVIGILAPTPYIGPDKNNFNRWAFAPFQMPAFSVGGRTMVALPVAMRDFTLAVKDTASLRAASAEVTDYLTQRYGEGAFVVRTFMLEAEQSRRDHNRLFVVIGFLAGAALLISSITLLNLMTTRTLRRSRSIGIFRSLGASGRDIFSIFLGESLVLTLIGGIAGFALAPALYHLLLTQLIPASWGVDLGAQINWLVMAGSLAGALALNVLFGIPPAAQAARTDIVNAIRAD